MMSGVRRGWMLVSVVVALLLRVASAQVTTTTVQDTVYLANGTAASGTVVVSWNAFTTAAGRAVPTGTLAVTLGAGGTSGLLSVALAPNAGATPMGSYYTAVYHLSDGSVSREYWVVPVAGTSGSTVPLSAVRNSVLPLSVAMQTVSKSYVDTAIAAAVSGLGSGSSGGPPTGAAGGDLGGTYPNPTVTAVHATGGTMDGVTIGATTAASAKVTTLSASSNVTSGGAAANEAMTSGGAVAALGTVHTAVANEGAFEFSTTYNSVRFVSFGPTSSSYAGLLFAQFTSVGGNAYNAILVDPATSSVGFGCGTATPALANCATRVTTAGAVTAVGYTETLFTPSSSGAACTAGQFADDASFHYVCVAANTWKRVALASF